ncbi:uncharacterized protein B0H18DRAFT_983268 [Fomitopsis serialis]|uniref:uncharacterized protein n=1 Tax=Fomitopsis serialis TaxID=139415 RepID=UPI0020076417|nr:uncharacterized protein B0H18DRAFT_983268 [Neoantrodia serialis]KAH9933360.1 hypothetical protein B0H18DRAFT_983268 [Neoantrodia serialis]
MHDADTVKAHGSDPTTAGMIMLGNVQDYLVQRDDRLPGHLISGLPATYVEAVDCDVTAFDVAEKQRLLRKNKRASLTVEQLLDFIDHEHRELVGVLQWLRTLVEHVPELSAYKGKVSDLYRTRGAKQRVPETKTKVHPLGCSLRRESIMSELELKIKNALVDFLGQIGQTAEEHNPRLILVSGDGFASEYIYQLKNYLGFHCGNSFENFDLIEPVLAMWHTGRTDLGRVFARHWGPSLSDDVSTLGHSANKIGLGTPSNLSKVDYKQGTEICSRVHWGTPDLFAYFAKRAQEKTLPSFEELETVALQLYRAYSTSRGYELAMHAQSSRDDTTPSGSSLGPPTAWERTIPIGSPWTSLTPGAEALATSTQACPALPNFEGDRVLAQSIALMRDAVVLREFVLATCDGDVGRVYEALKVMLFTFAGSTHAKYTTYLLETITNLELESTPELRHAILSNLVVNLTGQPGSFLPADLMQEYFSRLLDAVAEKEGVDYADQSVHDAISRNLHHFASLLTDQKDGVGLQHRSGKHSAKPELTVLTGIYREAELHSRRKGREYPGPAREVDDFRRGYEKLRDGKLKWWVNDSLFMRSVRVPVDDQVRAAIFQDGGRTDDGDSETEASDDDEDDSQDPDEPGATLPPLALTFVVDEELVIGEVDLTSAVESIVTDNN